MMRMLSLKDLDIVYHTEIKFDGFIIPIKIDIANITEKDYITAISIMNEYKKDRIEPQEKEYNELDDIKVVYFENDEIVLSYEKLYHQYELSDIEENEKLDFIFKFINTDLLQEDIENFILNEMTDIFLNVFFKTLSYWVDVMMTEFHNKVKALLILNDKNGIEMNAALSKLKCCYTTMQLKYFKENADKVCFDEFSYREQHLLQSFETKMNYIDIAINKKAREDAKQVNNNQPKGKRWSSSKRH